MSERMLNEPCSRRRFLQTGALGALGLLGRNGRAMGQAAEAAPLPPRRPADAIDGPPAVSARAWAVADGRSGRVLWGARESAELVMASTTKIMTAWLVIQHAAEHPEVLNETVTFSAEAARTAGSSSRLRAGERVPVRDLLYGLMLPSGNDAAQAFAEHFGSRLRKPSDPPAAAAAFVAQMNRQAEALWMAETHYFDPHGLGRNHTSARDLATLAATALRNPLFRQYVQTRRHQCEVADAEGAKRAVTWNNTNRLLEIEGYDGVKTGTTTAAGFCLVGSGRRNGDHLIAVVLGATSNDSRYNDTRNLFQWAWRQRAAT